MKENLQRLIERLRHVNVALRQRLELAELFIPQINAEIAQLGRLELLTDLLELGEIVSRRAYSPQDDRGDSEQLFQAAIAVPHGLCLAVWDMHEFTDAGSRPSELERLARNKLMTFDDCTPGLKALLLAEAAPLVDGLFRQITFFEADYTADLDVGGQA